MKIARATLHDLTVQVVSGLIVLAIAGSIAFVPGVASWLWRQLSTTVALPLWAFLLALVAVVALAIVVGRRSLAPATQAEPFPNSASPLASEPDELQRAIMRLFVQMDGGELRVHEMASKLRETRLRIGQALESLHRMGYVKPHYNALSGTTHSLTSAGRDYMLVLGPNAQRVR